MTTATIVRTGTRVTYLGYPATVIHGNEPDEWTGGQPSATVNIRLDRAVRGMSRQMDVCAASVLPETAAAWIADGETLETARGDVTASAAWVGLTRLLTYDDALLAAAALDEISAGHEQGAAVILGAARLDGLTNGELESLCAMFGTR